MKRSFLGNHDTFVKHCKWSVLTPQNLQFRVEELPRSLTLPSVSLGESRGHFTFGVYNHGRDNPFVALNPLEGFLHLSLWGERTPGETPEAGNQGKGTPGGDIKRGGDTTAPSAPAQRPARPL